MEGGFGNFPYRRKKSQEMLVSVLSASFTFAPFSKHEMTLFILATNKRIQQQKFLNLNHFNHVWFVFFLLRLCISGKGKPRSETFSLSSLAPFICLSVFLIGWTPSRPVGVGLNLPLPDSFSESGNSQKLQNPWRLVFSHCCSNFNYSPRMHAHMHAHMHAQLSLIVPHTGDSTCQDSQVWTCPTVVKDTKMFRCLYYGTINLDGAAHQRWCA